VLESAEDAAEGTAAIGEGLIAIEFGDGLEDSLIRPLHKPKI
jgi:hypothetical protein